VLIPGAGTAASAFQAVAERLVAAGHDAVPVDLPNADPDAGLPEYVDAALEAIGDREQLVVVAQSLGGFTALELCAHRPVEMLVFVNAMIPVPGESAGAWWENTAHEEAISALLERVGPMSDWTQQTEVEVFLNDCTPGAIADSAGHWRGQTNRIFEAPNSLQAWPDIPVRVIACTDDQFFPPDFQRRVAQERLGITPDEMPGDHVPMISRPAELARRLLEYVS
jgi:pimeloyl-ACP methyl ester carboxylesterase